MANIKSQIKRNRQNEAARERNKSVRSALKTSVRRFDEAVEAGGNATRVNGIRFGFDDPSKLRDDARQRAVADARRRAEELARLSGIKLGGPITVEELASNQTPAPTLALESADVARMPIERGTGSVSVEVRVRWAIRA